MFRLAAAKGSEPKCQVHEQESSEDEDSDLSPEEQGSLFTFCFQLMLIIFVKFIHYLEDSFPFGEVDGG